jgi:hypothetical protein
MMNMLTESRDRYTTHTVVSIKRGRRLIMRLILHSDLPYDSITRA